jgi:exodeoxyribonuclease V alpha subunit
VERLTYHSEASGYTVARFKAPRTHELITITGNFAHIQAGQTLELQGLWRDHPQYGPQFQVTRYQETRPATLTGLEKYLGSGLIKGVGPVTARRIVAHFGLQTLDIIEHQIHRLIEVPGIGQARVRRIQAAWAAQRAIQGVMVFLQGHGVSTTYAVKIYKQYGDQAIAVVTQNPYRLATDIYGIGFITADAIARNLGIAPGSEFRYRSGMLHVLSQAGEEGHCFLPQTELVERAVQRLALPDHQPQPGVLESLIHRMGEAQELVLEAQGGQVISYAPAFYQAEVHLAERLRQLRAQPLAVEDDRVQRWIDRFVAQTGLDLSAEQRQAVTLAASQRLLILTGGPGCGKTFTTRTIVALWRAMGKTVALASPTGRAAQRLAEVTGQPAQTLHRLLPSVGPGAVLQDLIGSGQVPVVRLTQVFRQAQASAIVTQAHRLNQGQIPRFEPVSEQPQSDCLGLTAPDPEAGVQGIRDLLTDLIPQLGFDPTRDVQVLSPMTRGTVGSRQLNQLLQGLLNPAAASKPEWQRGGLILRLGDRVIQQVNDYGREVFNGDLGVIQAIAPEDQEVTVDFGDRRVTYDAADLNEIALAWAITIHKSQGSEYPVVILPLFMSHYLMLSRNLLYTGLTRARRLAIVVGPEKAIAIAVRRGQDRHRYTDLARRLGI